MIERVYLVLEQKRSLYICAKPKLMESILFLPGALAGKTQVEALRSKLGEQYQAYALSFPGHEKESMDERAFNIEGLADYVLHWMDENNIVAAHIFGYSMGGYIALWLARFFPKRVKCIMTVGTKFHWDKEQALKEVKMLDPDKIEAKVPAFAETLRRKHGENSWRQVLQNTAHLMTALGQYHLLEEDFRLVDTPVLLCRGENDTMVSEAETLSVASFLKYGNICFFSSRGHAFEDYTTLEISDKLIHFLKSHKSFSIK